MKTKEELIQEIAELNKRVKDNEALLAREQGYIDNRQIKSVLLEIEPLTGEKFKISRYANNGDKPGFMPLNDSSHVDIAYQAFQLIVNLLAESNKLVNKEKIKELEVQLLNILNQ